MVGAENQIEQRQFTGIVCIVGLDIRAVMSMVELWGSDRVSQWSKFEPHICMDKHRMKGCQADVGAKRCFAKTHQVKRNNGQRLSDNLIEWMHACCCEPIHL